MQSHTFVLLTGNDIAIEPPHIFTSELGHQSIALGDYKRRVVEHNSKLSINTLRDFQDAAIRLLGELPTSTEEDAQILESLCSRAGLLVDSDRESEQQLRDLIVCVHYRWQFKQAVRAALASARRAILANERSRN